MKLNKTFNFEAKSGVRANAELKNASLYVLGSDDQQSQLSVTIESITKLPEDKDISEYYNFSYDENKNEIFIEQTDQKLPSLASSIKFALTIPRIAEISSKNKNGAIKVENISGEQFHKLVNGGCKIMNCEARLEIHTTNGGIKVLDHEGDISISQKNGGIVVMDSVGNMELSNKNGAIKLNHCSGKLELENNNGAIKVLNAEFSWAHLKAINAGIYYEFENIDEGNFSFHNSNGRINLIIPQEMEYSISAKTQMGTINIGLDKEYEQKGHGQKEFKLTNGSGKVEISAENYHGGINILDELHKSESAEGKISHKVEVLLKDKIIPTIENLTNENAPKVEKQIRKVGEKLSKIEINIPDIEDKIKNVINQVTESIHTNLEENADDIENIKNTAINSVNKTFDNISNSIKSQAKTNDERKDSVDERSRLKILELLEKGKINPDEAERLLKALGKKEA